MFCMGVEGETMHMPETYPVTSELAWDDITPVMWIDQNNTAIYIR